MSEAPLPPMKRALLDSAIEVFAQKGLHGTRIVDVTDHAGVAAGSFYTYFESKEDLFLEVVEGLKTRHAEAIPQPRIASLNEAKQWLSEVAQLYVQRLMSGAALWRMVNSAALGNTQVAAKLEAQSDPLAATLSSELELWAQRNWVDSGIPSTVTAEALIALAEQSVQYWSAANPRVGPATAAAIVADAWQAIVQFDPQEQP